MGLDRIVGRWVDLDQIVDGWVRWERIDSGPGMSLAPSQTACSTDGVSWVIIFCFTKYSA